ncbi:MAG: alpha/beta hydrolase [Thermoanaerobaculia bacterium]|nr:alpha/beta hydrolase [Thermoanaerobaculia bacterium]
MDSRNLSRRQDRVDEQFDLRRRHPSGRFYLLLDELQSYFARLSLDASLDVSYGETAGQKVDIFPAADPESPVFVFIHGGYFRALDKRRYSYLAKPIVRAGCTAVLINYDLAPAVSVKTIIDQNLEAFSWILRNISRWNGNPLKIVLCGHSVGAFLVAKILEHPWNQQARSAISGAVLLSGLYDLSPMRQSYLNRSLQLSTDDVKELSPIFGQLEELPPTLVAVGEDETEEFIRQSRNYSDKLEALRKPHEFLLLRGLNHYTVARLLSSKRTILVRKILGMCRS